MKISTLLMLVLWIAPGVGWAIDSPVARIASDLDSLDALVVARALSSLEALDDSSVMALRVTLEGEVSPRSRAILLGKLDAILTGMLAELDAAVTDFATARKRTRRPPKPSDEAKSGRETARNRVEKVEQKLAVSGLFLAPPLARHDEQVGTAISLVVRVRERLRERLRQQVENRWPQLPPARDIPEPVLRCLCALLPPRGEDPGWDQIAQRGAQLAIKELESFDRSRISLARSWLLDLGQTGRRQLLEWSQSSPSSPVPPGIRQEWTIRNRLRIPALVDLDSSISVANWDQLDASTRRDQLLQLRAVHGELVTPTLAILARDDPDPSVRRRCAELLSLLGDPRGARLLLAQRQFSASQVEAASRDAILRASVRLRNDGNLEGALALLDELARRITADAQIHHALGVVTMRMRDLDRAIDELEQAVSLDPTDASIHYNLACAWALSGDSEKALESLRQAMKHGYSDADHTLSDADLESLRGLRAFEQLIEQMQGS